MTDITIFVCKRCGARYFYFMRRVAMLIWDKKWNNGCRQCGYRETCPYHQEEIKEGLDRKCYRESIPKK